MPGGGDSFSCFGVAAASPPQAVIAASRRESSPQADDFQPQADTKAVDQFKREMAVIAKLEHPNIVRFIDSGITQMHTLLNASSAKRLTRTRHNPG